MDFYLDLLPEDDYDGHQWITDALRLIGNCCVEDSSITPIF